MKVLIKKPFGQWHTEEFKDISEIHKKVFDGLITEMYAYEDDLIIMCLPERGVMTNKFYNTKHKDKNNMFFGNVAMINMPLDMSGFAEENYSVPDEIIERFEGTTEDL